MDLAALKRGEEIKNRLIKIDNALEEIESIGKKETYPADKKIYFDVKSKGGSYHAYLTTLIPENMQDMLTDLIADFLLTKKLLLEKELELL